MFSYRKLIVFLFTICLPVTAFGSTIEQLNLSAAVGEVSFVLVIEPGIAGIEDAREMIQTAMAEVTGSVMIESDRTSGYDSDFIQKYQLASAPVPLILVFGPNGVMAGGNVLEKLTVEKLVALVPSPQKTEVLRAVQAGYAVYVTASRSGMPSGADVANRIEDACAKMRGRCIAVKIDLDDPAEKAFLNQMKVDLKTTKPITVVYNNKGQITEVFSGIVKVDDLIASATKVPVSSCCPPGSGKTCAPPKKGDK